MEALALQLLATASDRGFTLATAESCTGGLIASLLTDVDGLGHAFDRSFVVYSEDAKVEMLGISRELIDTHGAVSREVAYAMVDAALARSGADIAVAVTGFAGPAGPGDEPGLVHFGCAARGRPGRHRKEHFGDIGRGKVREQATRVALEMMQQALEP